MSSLAGQYFLQFVVPLIAVGASIFLKYVSRNDSHKAFRKEDLAVGLDLAVTALLLFATSGSKAATDLAKIPGDAALTEKLASLPWIICGLLVGIWILSTAVRKKGWVGDGSLDTVWGIIIPDVFGVIALLFAVNWIS